jgi:O-antigen/teichoic acid export membrane protein
LTTEGKIAKNTAIIGGASIILGILNLLFVSVVISTIGFEQYGLYVFILFLSVKNGVMFLFDFGIKTISIKYIAQHLALNEDREVNYFINFSLFFSLIVGLIVSVITLFFYDFIQASYIDTDVFVGFFDVFQVFIYSYIFQYLNHAFIGIFEGFQRYDIAKFIEIVLYTLQSISIIYIVSNDLSLNYMVYVLVIMYVLNFIINMIVLRIIFDFKISFNDFFKNFLKFYDMAKNIFPIQVSSVIFSQYPKIFILYFMNITYLGIYDVIIKIPRFLKTIAGFLNSALMPIASDLNAKSENIVINNIYKIGFKINIIIMTPILTGVIYFSMPIFDIWLDNVDHYEYMQTFMVWNLLVPYVTFGGPLLLAMNQELRFMKRVSWVIAILSIVVSFILINDMKIWALVYGQLAGFIILPFVFYKYMVIFKVNKMAFVRTNIYVYAIVIIPVMIFNFIDFPNEIMNLIFYISIWCILYYALIYALILNTEERKILQKIIKIL